MLHNSLMPLILLILVAIGINLNASDYNNRNGYDRNQEQEEFTGEIPFDKRKISQPKIVQKVRFELGLKEKEANVIQHKMQKKVEILDGVAGINILQNPVFKPLKTVTTIYLHPNFITTLIFPKQFKIANKPRVSFPTKVFEYDTNTVRIRPTTSMRVGNMTLALSDGKKNYSITIFYKRYIPDLECNQKGYSDCKNNFLATVIRFTKARKIDPFDIIEEYQKMNNISRISIEKNHGYLIFSKDGQTYYIIRDDEFGTIYKDGLSLKVETTL